MGTKWHCCKVEDCDTLARGGQGYCSTHWDAIRLYGTLTPTFNCIVCLEDYQMHPKKSSRRVCGNCTEIWAKWRHKRTVATKHGMTILNYIELGDSQNWCCKMCGWYSTEKLTIDHDHRCCHSLQSISCGKCIMGMLCNNCNTMLGHYQKIKGHLIIPEFENYLKL